MSVTKRFLIVRLSSIGDVLHATPVARTLKEKYPDCHITWIVSELSADLLRCNQYVDKLHIWSREKFEEAIKQKEFLKAYRIWQELNAFFSENTFDIAFDIHGIFISGMVTAASKAPLKIGMSNTKELNRFFMNKIAPPSDDIHVIKRYLSVLKLLDISTKDFHTTLKISEEAMNFAKQFLKNHNLDKNKPLVAISPTTSWSSKNWPIENYIEVMRKLHTYCNIILCGSKGDKFITQKIKDKVNLPLIDAVGKTSLMELGALLSQVNLLISGDTGTLHMADALNIKTIGIFGPTNHLQYGPLSILHKPIQGSAICAPCHKKRCKYCKQYCFDKITPKLVIDQVKVCLC